MVQARSVREKLPFGGEHELGEGTVEIIGVKTGTVTIGFGQDVVVAIGARCNIYVEFEAAIVVQYPVMMEGVDVEGCGYEKNQ